MNKELHASFLQQMRDVYDAEHRIVEALPKLAEAARADEVRAAFQDHLDESKNHIERLRKAFSALGEQPERETCQAAEGLVKEGEQLISENRDSSALDAVLICIAQKVEHYEIATYGTLCTWAKCMGHSDALEQLKANLGEEKAADEKLTNIANEVANREPEHSTR